VDGEEVALSRAADPRSHWTCVRLNSRCDDRVQDLTETCKDGKIMDMQAKLAQSSESFCEAPIRAI
jgi:hypothetical protein